MEVREIGRDDLSAKQQVVGGLIAFTDVPKLKASIVSNDSGLLLELPPNSRGTWFLYEHAPEHIGYTYLVGSVFVCGMPDDRGNTKSVPDGVLQLLGVE